MSRRAWWWIAWVGAATVAGMALSLLIAVMVAGSPERDLQRAKALLDAGQPEQAERWLDRPEAAAPTRDRALLLRARAALERGRPGEAVEPLNRVDPNGRWATDAAYWKGRTVLAAKNPVAAVAWFRRVREARPRDLETLRWLAAACYDLGDWPASVEALEALTRLAPRDARAWRTLGVLFKEEGRLEQARSAYETSLANGLHEPKARLELADCLARLGRHQEARRQLDACAGGVPEADRVALLVECARAGGELEEARDLLDRALAVFPEHGALLSQRARLAEAEGRNQEAAEWLDRAVATAPDNPEWLYQRGRVLRALGRTKDGDRDLARARAINDDTATLSKLSREASRHPDDPEVRSRLGQLCARLGKPELAAYWYRAALACQPDHAEARRGLTALGRR